MIEAGKTVKIVEMMGTEIAKAIYSEKIRKRNQELFNGCIGIVGFVYSENIFLLFVKDNEGNQRNAYIDIRDDKVTVSA